MKQLTILILLISFGLNGQTKIDLSRNDTLKISIYDGSIYQGITNFMSIKLKSYLTKTDSVLILINEHNDQQKDSLIFKSGEDFTMSYLKSAYDNRSFLYSFESENQTYLMDMWENFSSFNVSDSLKNTNNAFVEVNVNVEGYTICLFYNTSLQFERYFIINLFI
jgi:hypothetical protein